MWGEWLLTDNEKWEAVIRDDKAYDGLFFYAVKTTGIFCRSACKAKAPIRKNVVFFDTIDAAIAAGFRPCKLCRPDMVAYEPDAELVQQAKELLGQFYDKPINLCNIAKQLNISQSHLARLFKQNTGVTIRQFIISIRITKACSLLRQTNAGILEIAYQTGFQSISNFHRYFKELTGLTPTEFRKAGG